jgi:hypothetical protein
MVERASGRTVEDGDPSEVTELWTFMRARGGNWLDRLARNVAFISNLMESKVEFEAVDFPQANRLTIHIMAAIAEHEAKILIARARPLRRRRRAASG